MKNKKYSDDLVNERVKIVMRLAYEDENVFKAKIYYKSQYYRNTHTWSWKCIQIKKTPIIKLIAA